MKVSISLAQIAIQFSKPFLNLEHCISLIKEAGQRGSHLILLPELWSSGYDLPDSSQYSQDNHRLVMLLSTLAKELKIIIASSMLETIQNRHYNTFTIISDDGSISKGYQKIHLFPLMDEHLWLTAGDHLNLINFQWGICAPAICYDLRFPELFRNLALNGAQIFLIPAEWPLKRISHWKTLLRARAIENQAFVAAVNCVGQCGGETFGGSSAIISPLGETLLEGSQTAEELLTREVDLEEVGRVRSIIPVFNDRRPDIYNNKPFIE